MDLNRQLDKGHLFFIETNMGTNIFEVIESEKYKVTIQDNENSFIINKSTLAVYEFMKWGIVYLGKV